MLCSLTLDDRGRNAEAHEDGMYHRLARSGRVVCAADIRGIGDMRPEVGRGDPAYTVPHDSEEDFAWASLILGSSLLAQRVQDILAVLQALKNEPGIAGQQIILAARGRLTVPALFAFAASPLADSLYLAGGLISYRNLLETEDYRASLANFGWDLFRHVDLPLTRRPSRPSPHPSCRCGRRRRQPDRIPAPCSKFMRPITSAARPHPRGMKAPCGSGAAFQAAMAAFKPPFFRRPLLTRHTSSGTTNGAR